jgi:hypothetical protein
MCRGGDGAGGGTREQRSERTVECVSEGVERPTNASAALRDRQYHPPGSGRAPVGPPVFKTGDAALGVAWWVRLPRVPADGRRSWAACLPYRPKRRWRTVWMVTAMRMTAP